MLATVTATTAATATAHADTRPAPTADATAAATADARGSDVGDIGDAARPPWVDRLRGRFLVFDGPDGSGKSTQFHRFSHWAQARGLDVCEVREPGGTYIGEQVRRLLLDPTNREEIDLRAEMLLFMASRAQLIAQRIRPDLAAGCLVLADRFISSTLAYQGAAGGLPVDDILAVGRVALGGEGGTWPDLTVVFDVDEHTAASRLSPLLDRMEQKGVDYHRLVRRGYLDQSRADPQRYAVVDATREPDEVFGMLLHTLESRSRTLR